LQTRGAIYHHKDLVFKNGFTGKKYLVLLNSPSGKDPYLFVKTTSQKKNKPATPGCIKNHSVYFIPGGKAFFRLDTWVQLHEIYEIMPKDIDSKNGVTIRGRLDVKIIYEIVNCLFKAEGGNIPANQKDLLRPPILNGIHKLKDKFDKSRC
jgi:hypothetical protein